MLVGLSLVQQGTRAPLGLSVQGDSTDQSWTRGLRSAIVVARARTKNLIRMTVSALLPVEGLGKPWLVIISNDSFHG